jgi:hypothetical protein
VDVVMAPASSQAPAALLPPRASFNFGTGDITSYNSADLWQQVGSLAFDGVAGAQVSISLGTFAVRAGDTVSIAVVYNLALSSLDGGGVVVDALGMADWGLNVPALHLRLDT